MHAVPALVRWQWRAYEVTVRLLGGDLQIKWDRENDIVYMTGPAEVVFDGEWND